MNQKAETQKPETQKPVKSKTMVNILLILLVILLAVVPVLFLKNAEFGGSDDQAEQAITEINSDYKPWFSPVWEPPSGEVESLLFALQAALGAGFVGYFLGYSRGRKKKEELGNS